MLKVFSASASERFACSQAKRTTDGMGQVPKSTSAFTPAGKARFRFSVMPPPVMWATPCTGRPFFNRERIGFT